ncbi:MAG: NAD(P)-dependent alcohol dehydrogenase [Nitrospinales bacterium]
MKAVKYTEYGSPDVLKIADVEMPTPKDDEVLIKVHASTVSAVDSQFRRGDSFFARIFTGLFKPKNQNLGEDLSGEVVSVGKDVTSFKTGDKVFGVTDTNFGAHAEYICLPEQGTLLLMPEGSTYEEAAAIPYGAMTALPFLRDAAKIESGQSILVNGASGAVGVAAIQLAKHFGAHVTGVCSSRNLELAKSIGADEVIDYTQEDFVNNGKTYDIIFDTVGKVSFSHCKNSLTPTGIYITAQLTVTILFQMMFTSKAEGRKAVIAFTGMRVPSIKTKDFTIIKELADAGELKPVVDKTYPIEKIAEAHAYVDTGHKKGSVVITIQDNK